MSKSIVVNKLVLENILKGYRFDIIENGSRLVSLDINKNIVKEFLSLVERDKVQKGIVIVGKVVGDLFVTDNEEKVIQVTRKSQAIDLLKKYYYSNTDDSIENFLDSISSVGSSTIKNNKGYEKSFKNSYGVAVKVSVDDNPLILADDMISIYKECERLKGKFAVSLGNLQIDKKRAKVLNYVLLIFPNKERGRKALLGKIDSFSIKKELHIPDEMTIYTTELNNPSRAWFLLSDSREVDDEYLRRCELVFEKGMLIDRLNEKSRFPRAYFKEV